MSKNKKEFEKAEKFEMGLQRKQDDTGVVGRYNFSVLRPRLWGVWVGVHSFVYSEKNAEMGGKVIWKTEKDVMKSIVVDKESHSGFFYIMKNTSWKVDEIHGFEWFRRRTKYRIAILREVCYEIRIYCERSLKLGIISLY